MTVRPILGAAIAALIVCGGCAGRAYLAPALAPLPWPADTVRADVIADGVTLRYLYLPKGPWAIHVLDVDLSRCNTAVAVKQFAATPASAVGRTKTSALLSDLATRARVIGGVNADFFSLTAPLGVPVGALVVDGAVLTGPATQSVLAFDSSGAPSIVTLSARGSVVIGSNTYPVANWNRAVRNGDRKSTRLNSSHLRLSRMPSSA